MFPPSPSPFYSHCCLCYCVFAPHPAPCVKHLSFRFAFRKYNGVRKHSSLWLWPHVHRRARRSQSRGGTL
jgi:hypothetical protein